MPNYRVGDTPVQLAQSGARGFLVRNIGSVPVYLEEGSTVSSTAYGLELQPLDSANWPQDKALWIVTALGAVGDISVLYGAEGVSLGAVSAVVTGDVTATIDGPVDANITNASIAVTGDVTIDNASIPVTGTVDANITNAVIDATITGDVNVLSGEVNVGGILTPVQVQGGGAVLLNQSGTINAGASLNINIPGPADGLTYFGIGVIVTNTSKTISNDIPFICRLRNFGTGTGSPSTVFYAGLVGSGGLNLGGFGSIASTGIAVPVGTGFPITLTIDNNGGSGNMGYRAIAIGISQADTLPRDFGQWNNGIESRVTFNNSAAGSYVTVAASMETRDFLLQSVSATAGGNFSVEGVDSSGTWLPTMTRAHNNLYGNATPAANIPNGGNSIVTIPGDGAIHRIICVNALTGAVNLSHLGRR